MAVKRTEAMIQRACMDWLATQDDVYFFRANSGAFRTAQGRYVKTGRPGCPDIVACWRGGQFWGIEVKAEKGRQTQAQKKAQADIEAAGGRYVVVRSVGELKELINDSTA